MVCPGLDEHLEEVVVCDILDEGVQCDDEVVSGLGFLEDVFDELVAAWEFVGDL